MFTLHLWSVLSLNGFRCLIIKHLKQPQNIATRSKQSKKVMVLNVMLLVPSSILYWATKDEPSSLIINITLNVICKLLPWCLLILFNFIMIVYICGIVRTRRSAINPTQPNRRSTDGSRLLIVQLMRSLVFQFFFYILPSLVVLALECLVRIADFKSHLYVDIYWVFRIVLVSLNPVMFGIPMICKRKVTDSSDNNKITSLMSSVKLQNFNGVHNHDQMDKNGMMNFNDINKSLLTDQSDPEYAGSQILPILSVSTPASTGSSNVSRFLFQSQYRNSQTFDNSSAFRVSVLSNTSVVSSVFSSRTSQASYQQFPSRYLLPPDADPLDSRTRVGSLPVELVLVSPTRPSVSRARVFSLPIDDRQNWPTYKENIFCQEANDIGQDYRRSENGSVDYISSALSFV